MRETRRANGLEILRRTGAAVGQKITLPLGPQRLIAFQHGRQCLAHIARTAQLPVGQPRPEPERLPGQCQVAIVIDLGPFKLLPADLQLRVVEKHFGAAGIFPASGFGALGRPRDELLNQFPERTDTLRCLRPQPFSQSGFIGKTIHARQSSRQRILLEPFRIGQRRAAGGKAINELGHDGIRTKAAALAFARINERKPAQLVPQVELLSQRLDGRQAPQHRLPLRGDELEFDFRRTFMNGRHEVIAPCLRKRSQLKLRRNAVFFTRRCTR